MLYKLLKTKKQIVNIHYILQPSFITKSPMYAPADVGLQLASLIFNPGGTAQADTLIKLNLVLQK